MKTNTELVIGVKSKVKLLEPIGTLQSLPLNCSLK